LKAKKHFKKDKKLTSLTVFLSDRSEPVNSLRGQTVPDINNALSDIECQLSEIANMAHEIYRL